LITWLVEHTLDSMRAHDPIELSWTRLRPR
jgi:hypothetical protein